MSLKEFFESEYISPQEVTDGDKAVIITPPVMKEGNYEGRTTKKLQARVEYKNKQRILSWNITNAKVCRQTWGDEEKDWVGKVVVLKTVTKPINGQLQKCLVIEPEQPAVPKVEKPDWMTEEMIQDFIKKMYNLVGREGAITILAKERELQQKAEAKTEA